MLKKTDNESVWIANRLKIIFLWQSVGRTGEVALSSWRTAYWSSQDQMLGLTWKEIKTGKEYLMTYFSDANGFIMDFYHAVGSYLIDGGGWANYKGSLDRNEVIEML